MQLPKSLQLTLAALSTTTIQHKSTIADHTAEEDDQKLKDLFLNPKENISG